MQTKRSIRMPTDRQTLVAEERQVTGKAVSKIRRAGRLPAVVYGHGVRSANVSLDAHIGWLKQAEPIARANSFGGDVSMVFVDIGADNCSAFASKQFGNGFADSHRHTRYERNQRKRQVISRAFDHVAHHQWNHGGQDESVERLQVRADEEQPGGGDTDHQRHQESLMNRRSRYEQQERSCAPKHARKYTTK